MSRKRKVREADNLPSTNCLICYRKIQASLSDDRFSVGAILNDLFDVFAEYIGWKTNRDFDFNFMEDVFPFCDECKRVFIKVYRLNQEMNSILQQIHQLVVNVSAQILLSESKRKASTNKSASRTSGDFERKSRKKRFKESNGLLDNEVPLEEKIQCFRELVISKYDINVRVKRHELTPTSRNRSRKPVKPSNVQFGAYLEGKQAVDIGYSKILVKGECKRNNTKNSKNTAGSDPKGSIPLNPLRSYKCNKCGQTYQNKKHMEKHQSISCGKNKNGDSVVKVSKGKCLYRQHTFESQNGSLQCGSCDRVFVRLEQIKMHIIKSHTQNRKSSKKRKKQQMKSSRNRRKITNYAISECDENAQASDFMEMGDETSLGIEEISDKEPPADVNIVQNSFYESFPGNAFDIPVLTAGMENGAMTTIDMLGINPILENSENLPIVHFGCLDYMLEVEVS